jgi:O-antigen/teichoic acid export membrane protein
MFKKILSNDLNKGIIILFITINIFNFLNFVFHFSTARLLGPADYGVLAVLMAIVNIYGVPAEAIQNMITKYSSKFNSKKEYGKIKFLMGKSLRKSLRIASYVFIFLFILTFFLSWFLKISFWLILFTNLIIFFSFSIPTIRGVLQGRKKFLQLGMSMVIESGLKLFFALSFIVFGFKVFGAIGGMLMGIFAGLIFSLYFNKDLLNKKEEETSFNGIYLRSVKYFVVTFVVLLFFSLDIIFARKFFSAEIAGQYAVLSMLGKMIYFSTLAVGKTMFPLTSEKSGNGKESFKLFKKSLGIIIVLCAIVLIFYAFFPEMIIKILYGKQYLSMANFLIFSGISLTFLSLTNLILIYGLSTNRLKNPYYLFIFLAIEILLFYLFHSTILEYILAFMVSNIIIFIGSFLFIKKHE